MTESRFARWLDVTMDNRAIKNAELATVLGVSEGTVSRWRNGLSTPRLANLAPLAKEFGVDVLQLAVTAGEMSAEDAGVPPLTVPYPHAMERTVRSHLARLDLSEQSRAAMLDAWRESTYEENQL